MRTRDRDDPPASARAFGDLLPKSARSSGPRAVGDEQGSVAPLAAVLVLIAGLLCLGVGRLGGGAVAAAQARSAADAAALAGASDGEGEAREMAKANGGRLVGYEVEGVDTQVWVEVQGVEMTARARRVAGGVELGGLGGAPGGGPGRVAGLAPAMRAAVARAEQLLGRPVPVTSGFRSTEQQAALWRPRATNRYPVAPPGSSMHERGLAIDVPASFVPVLAGVARQAGLCHPYPRTDPVHFELCRSP